MAKAYRLPLRIRYTALPLWPPEVAQTQGRSRGGFGTKLHVLVDAQGGLLACRLTPGQAHDRPQAEGLLEGFYPDYVLADRSYDDDDLRRYIVA